MRHTEAKTLFGSEGDTLSLMHQSPMMLLMEILKNSSDLPGAQLEAQVGETRNELAQQLVEVKSYWSK